MIAYNVGANTNYLSSTQTTFTDLVSTNHHKQLKAPMRDAMINKLSHWAKNHEMRLQTYAQSTNYPHLTDDQLAFGSYLSTKNNNMLTAPMRDGLMGDFTNVITNHEMRLRCIQDGSCLKAQSTESPIGSGEAVLVVTNPLDMVFGANQTGSSYARALKLKGINIRLQEDDPRLRYYSKNPNIIQPYGSDTVADFVPLTGGITQVCAYLMENGRKIE
ncbi:MAG: hypothetical protein Q4B28_01535 [bacterium]|nr:hypothetical protein [bacterium]